MNDTELEAVEIYRNHILTFEHTVYENVVWDSSAYRGQCWDFKIWTLEGIKVVTYGGINSLNEAREFARIQVDQMVG